MQVNQYSIRFIEKGLAGVSMSMIADMSAVSFAMTVHGLMDYELDQKYGYDEEPKNLLDEYLKWFCTENQVEAGD